MADRPDPYRQFRFRVDIGGIDRQVSANVLLRIQRLIPLSTGRRSNHPRFRKLSGLTKYGNITLKWGTTDSMDLYKWSK